DKISIVVSGQKQSVNEFRKLIKKNISKPDSIIEKNRKSPVKIGFEIINSVPKKGPKKTSNRVKHRKRQQVKNESVIKDRVMFAGYMRSPKTPGHMPRLLAIMCQHRGIDLLYLTPDDVLIDTGKVIGKKLVGSKWVTVEANLPSFIDINPNYFNKEQYSGLMKYLKKNSILSADRRMPLPKDELHQAFNSDSEVSKYLIPSQSVKSIQDINEFLDMYGTVVLKPVRSNRGRNVFILKQHGSKY